MEITVLFVIHYAPSAIFLLQIALFALPLPIFSHLHAILSVLIPIIMTIMEALDPTFALHVIIRAPHAQDQPIQPVVHVRLTTL